MSYIKAVKYFLNMLSPRPYSLLRKYYYHFKFLFFVPPLKEVAIEINSFCNRKCLYCPNHNYEKEKAFLDEKLFYKIIDELKGMGFKGVIHFNLFNEPLLDPRLSKFIKHIRNELPAAFMNLNTNGDFLNLTLWKELRVAGLNYAIVTQYDGKINEHMQKFLNELNVEEKKHINVSLLGWKFNRAGLVQGDYVGELPLKRFCRRPFYQLCINYKGKAVLCCNDYFGLVEIADVRDEKISAIWENEIFKYYRKKLTREDRDGLKLCDKCDMDE